MSAYFIVDVDVQDPAGMREYLERVPETLKKYGGRYIVRGGEIERGAGDRQTHRGGVVGNWKWAKATGSPRGWSCWSPQIGSGPAAGTTAKNTSRGRKRG